MDFPFISNAFSLSFQNGIGFSLAEHGRKGEVSLFFAVHLCQCRLF
jgi:hypothetical protein